MPTAITGLNGKSGIDVGSSNLVALSYYDDKNLLLSSDLKYPNNSYDFWINRNSINNLNFSSFNLSNSNQTSSDILALIGFQLPSANLSVHFHLKPPKTSQMDMLF